MTDSRRRRTCLVGLASLLLILAPAVAATAHAQAQATLAEGLDLVILVDVSRSMFTQGDGDQDSRNDPPDGSDPKRIRWDAVGLILNLLTAEDQVLIVPFNQDAPARHVFPDGRLPVMVPGELSQQFVSAAEARRVLSPWVESFTHPDNRDLPNTDTGGTGIINALIKSAALARIDGHPPGRRVAAVLLTDGREGDKPDVFAGVRDADLAARLGPWAVRSGRETTPVYVVGLGPQVAQEQLIRIANATGGSFTPAASSGDLIGIFRQLVWELKDCWTKSLGPKDLRSATDTMLGIDDFGVLSYCLLNDAVGAASPRNTRPLQQPPRNIWDEGGQAIAIPGERRAGKDQGVYSYDYFGPSGGERSPFAEFVEPRRKPLRLSTTWDEPATVLFAKRTAQPLFKLEEPTEGRSLARYRRQVVRVVMNESTHFRPDQFLLKLAIKPQGEGYDGSTAEVLKDLEAKPNSRVFECDLPLAQLPRRDGPKDYYRLRIRAEGLTGTGHSLERYRLDLRPMTLGVDNSLALSPVEPVVLTGDQPSARRTLQSIGPAPGGLTVRWSLTPPKAASDPLPADAVLVRQVGPGDGPFSPFPSLALIKGSTEIGSAEIEIALNPGRLPTPGVVYEPGKLAILDGSGKSLLEEPIPIGLRIKLAELVLSPPAIRLEAKPGGDVSPAAKVETARPVDLAMLNGPLRIQLVPRAGQASFSTKELWIATEDEPAQSSRQVQELEIAPGRPFRIHFNPKPDRAKENRQHVYEWIATARGAQPSKGTLTLDYKGPSLAIPPGPQVVRLARGREGRIAVPIRLVAQPGDERAVYFQPSRLEAGRPVLESRDGAASKPTARVLVDYPTIQKPLLLRATGEASDEVPLVLGFTAPDDLGFGQYVLRGTVVGPGVREKPIDVEVIVNAFQISIEDPKKPGEWISVDQPVAIKMPLDRTFIKKVRIKTQLKDTLAPGSLQVSVPGPFKNDDGDRRRALPKVTKPDQEAKELEYVFKFDSSSNLDPHTSYRVRAEVESAELGLGETFEFVVRFLETSGRTP